MRPTPSVLALALAAGLATAAALAQPSTDAAAMIARIEAPQLPDRQGLDALTLDQVMRRFRVPGVSVAVIRDFKIDWAKAYGVADASTGRPCAQTHRFKPRRSASP